MIKEIPQRWMVRDVSGWSFYPVEADGETVRHAFVLLHRPELFPPLRRLRLTSSQSPCLIAIDE